MSKEKKSGTGSELHSTSDSVLITHQEICAVLGFKKDYVLNALRRGDIPAHKVGGRWIISRVTFFRWLDGMPLAKSVSQGPSA